MEVIKFQDEIISGDQLSTLKWTQVTDKNELIVEPLTSKELFEDLEIYWNDLEKRSNTSDCMSFDWAFNWWKHVGKSKQRSLFIITVWDGTKLVGLVPLYKGMANFESSITKRTLQFIGSVEGVDQQHSYEGNDKFRGNNYLDIIIDKNYTDIVTERLLYEMTPSFLEVDVVNLNRVADDSLFKQQLCPKLQRQGLAIRIAQEAK